MFNPYIHISTAFSEKLERKMKNGWKDLVPNVPVQKADDGLVKC